MKILTRAEVAARKDAELGREARELMELSAATDRERKALAAIRGEKEAWLADFKKRIEDETAPLAAARDGLQNEVKGLEERRRAALAPIAERVRAAERREAEVAAREREADGREASNVTRQAELAEVAEALDDRAAAVASAEAALKAREEGAAREAETLLGMQREFASRQSAHAEAVSAHAADVAAHEARVAADKAALDAERRQLDDQRAEQAERERGIRSGYEALRAARKEILGRED